MAGLRLARSLPRPRLSGLGSLELPGLPPGPVLRRRAITAAVALLALLALYLLWFRDSSLVAVEEVAIDGAEQRPDIESALRAAALEQTTLHVDRDALHAAVAAEPAVRSLSVDTDFPRGLEISVDLRDPVAYLSGGGLVVAGDGIVLERTGRPATDELALIEVKGADAAAGRSLEGDALLLARALGAAPPPLRAEVEAIRLDPDYGIVATLRAGIDLRFGAGPRTDLKWRAAAAVLADPRLEAVEYIDLSVPSRPVAGGLPPEQVDEPLAEVESVVEPPVATEPIEPPPAEAVEPSPAATEAAEPPPLEPSPDSQPLP